MTSFVEISSIPPLPLYCLLAADNDQPISMVADSTNAKSMLSSILKSVIQSLVLGSYVCMEWKCLKRTSFLLELLAFVYFLIVMWQNKTCSILYFDYQVNRKGTTSCFLTGIIPVMLTLTSGWLMMRMRLMKRIANDGTRVPLEPSPGWLHYTSLRSVLVSL